MITKVLGFGLDFSGKKCSDLNLVNRNVIVDEVAVVSQIVIFVRTN